MIALGVFVVGAFLLFSMRPKPASEPYLAPAGRPLESTSFRLPQNAFLPNDSGRGVAGGAFPSYEEAGKQAAGSPAGKPQGQQFQANLPSIQDVKDAVETALGEKFSQSELLLLPSVSDAELMIDPGGVTSTAGYLSYFAANQTAGIKFDYGKFAQVAKGENGIPLFSYELVGKVLGGDNFSSIRGSFNVQKEFLLAKINFFKSIKVGGEAVVLNKKMIAFDKLTLTLIDKASDFGDGKLSKSKLQDFYDKYQATAIANHEEFIKKSGLLGLEYKDNFFYKLANFLGLANIVFAQIPFGGAIAFTAPCTCPPTGLAITVGPPVGGIFYLTTPFIASPLFFPFKAPHIGAFILGLFEPVPVPCNIFPFCAFVLPPVTMAGTSL